MCHHIYGQLQGKFSFLMKAPLIIHLLISIISKISHWLMMMQGARVGEKDEEGNTPLHLVQNSNKIEIKIEIKNREKNSDKN